MGRFTQDGVIYEEVGNGQVRVVGYEDAPANPAPNGGVVVGTPRQPDPMDAAIEAERLRQLRLSNDKASQPPAPPAPNLPQGWMMGPDGVAAPIPGLPASAGASGMTAEARSALMNQYRGLANVARGVNALRQQYRANLSGRNPFEGRVGNLRPQDGIFDNTANGMTAYMAGLLGLSGQQFNTPGEQQLFIGSLLPNSTDTDEQIIAKLNNIDGMLATARGQGQQLLGLTPQTDILARDPNITAFERRVAPQRNDQPAAGAIPTGGAGGPPSGPVDPFGQGGPVALPTARGAHGDAGIGADGVTGEAGGMRVVPELYGLGGEISSLIQQGATREQVLAHYQDRMQRAGAPVTMGQVAIINEVMQKHQQFPNAPVASLASGWDNFHMQSTGGTWLGRAVDAPVIGEAIAGTIGAANGLSGGGLRALQGDQGRSVMDYSQAERPIPTFVGDALGTTGAMVATSGGANALARTGAGLATRGGMLGRAGGAVGRLAQAASRGNGVMLDTGYGAVRGAVEADPGNGVVGALGGALAGAAGNAVGQGMANVVGRGVRGVTDPSVRYLADRGINMSLGQMLGNSTMPGRFFNKLESIPVVGDMMAARRADSIGDYGRAQLAENLAPIGYRPPAGPFNQAMLGDAQNAISNAYRQTFDGVNITPDSQFAQEAGAALRQGEGVVDMGQKFRQLMDNQVGNLFDTPTGQLDGPQLQAALSRTREIGASLRGTGDPVAPLVGDAADNFGNALNGLVERQAPGTIPQLRAANQAYAGLVPIENAAITGTNNGGLFTPAQYGRAAVNNTRRFGGRGAAARGDVPGGELQRHAQDIIPSTIPDSGTAGRGMAAMLLPAALGGSAIGAGTFTDHPIASAGLGALALLSTRGGSRALQRTMMGGARRQRLGQALLDNQSNAGLLGSALLIPAYSASGQ